MRRVALEVHFENDGDARATPQGSLRAISLNLERQGTFPVAPSAPSLKMQLSRCYPLEVAPMLLTLVDHLPEPAVTPRIRLRERRHPCGLYIRKVKGFKYQLRWWLQGHGSVNCGLYDETDAELVRKELVPETAHHPATPLGLWKALQKVLCRLRQWKPGTYWPEILPMWVRRHAEGGYYARVKVGGKVIETKGSFRKPEAAHLAMAELLGRTEVAEKTDDGPRWLTLLDLATAA
jgi:hypothetical protein